MQMYSNLDDSGIDSDDAAERPRELRRQHEPRRILESPVYTDTDSEEDAVERVVGAIISGIIKDNIERADKIDEFLSPHRQPPTKMLCKTIANLDVNDFLEASGRWESPEVGSSPGRSSPPLYEVELTASDEDDDASVLELVIPMQARYQRVPTSSPLKSSNPRPRPHRLFSIFCCLRK